MFEISQNNSYKILRLSLVLFLPWLCDNLNIIDKFFMLETTTKMIS